MDLSRQLTMFLEESKDNLQALNDALLVLEQNPYDKEKLNEIFRIAHTFKGMSGTMGFDRMAELTHKMEDVLTEFREGELVPGQTVVTALFRCLDTLEGMVSSIENGEGEDLPIEEILELLTEAGTTKTDAALKVKKQKEVNTSSQTVMDFDEFSTHVMEQALNDGYYAYSMHIDLDRETLLKSARVLLVFTELEKCGEVIKSNPGGDDFENGNFDFAFDLFYITDKTASEVRDMVLSIGEVTGVTIEEVKREQLAALEKQRVKTYSKARRDDDKSKVTSSLESRNKKMHQSVRVDLEKLDSFMNMVSELVIYRSRLEQLSAGFESHDLNETLEQVGRTTSELQELVMKIRMLPVDTVFNRFPRMIRDLSVELGKEIDLIIQGQDTEIDRTVIDEIGEPLIHLLRNAADHGIESAEERLRKGKSPNGTIRLSAYQEGNKAVLKVSDDGAGINLSKIRAKAEKLGISTIDKTEDELISLIFEQGFSTNEIVTDVSGRGVGLDVVKTKITALGGTVDITSEKDKGTTFTITLPLTLQIIQALLVKVGGETMAISLGYIDRIIDFDKKIIKKSKGKEIVMHGGHPLPFIRLNQKLGLEEQDEGKKYIVIARAGGKNVGLLIDALLGQQEVVIKELSSTLKKTGFYIGATILGDGLVTLILDVTAIASR